MAHIIFLLENVGQVIWNMLHSCYGGKESQEDDSVLPLLALDLKA